MTDNFDIKKFLTENKVFWNPTDGYTKPNSTKPINENNLRGKIREMVLAELSKDSIAENEEEDMDDYFFNIDTPEEDLDEAKKDEEETIDVDLEEEPIEPEMDPAGDLDAGEVEIMDSLEKALEFAKKKGDEKLIDQIGNTITFFTRQYIVK